MKLRRNYKAGTLIRFKWYYNGDQYSNPNASYVIKEAYVDSNTFLDDVIVHEPQSDTYYSVPLSNVINF